MEDFKNRREQILGLFGEAKQQLEQLNEDIGAEISSNNQEIEALKNRNVELVDLIGHNKKAISFFTNLFKK